MPEDLAFAPQFTRDGRLCGAQSADPDIWRLRNDA
jgi:hypothetical protein